MGFGRLQRTGVKWNIVLQYQLHILSNVISQTQIELHKHTCTFPTTTAPRPLDAIDSVVTIDSRYFDLVVKRKDRSY